MGCKNAERLDWDVKGQNYRWQTKLYYKKLC